MMTGNARKGGKDAETEDVSRMLGALRRVDAPADFETQVRRRITAASAPAGIWPGAIFSFRFAAMAAGAVLVASLIYFSGIGIGEKDSINIAEQETDQGIAAGTENQTAIPPESATAQGAELEKAGKDESAASGIASPPRKLEPGLKKRQPIKRKSVNADGGSVVRALRARPDRIFPDGAAPRQTVEPDNGIGVAAALLQMGIESEFDTNWIVTRVLPESPAKLSGLVKGDIVEEINDQRAELTTRIPAERPVEKLTIRRKGDSIVLKISPK